MLYSATLKIGASGSLLIATITLESFMPAKCWMAPEIPAAMYSCGATNLPVWPTCQSLGAEPASTAAGLAAIAVSSSSARGFGSVALGDFAADEAALASVCGGCGGFNGCGTARGGCGVKARGAHGDDLDAVGALHG